MSEKEPLHNMTILVIGPSCSGKTTLLSYLRESGKSVHPEPVNVIFPLFIKNPHTFGYLNQLNLTVQLMALEAQHDAKQGHAGPQFIESGVWATDIYNRYLKDQKEITPEEFEHLDWVYRHHIATHPNPDLVVYLTADDEDLKKRSIMRDGAVALDPSKLQPYWNRLIHETKTQGVSVVTVNTSVYSPVEATQLLLHEVENVRAKRRVK